MNPAGVSNVENYALNNLSPGLLGGTSSFPGQHQSARYDPATRTVTLVPKRKLTYKGFITVTQGYRAKASGRAGHSSNAGPGLTDRQGNPINVDTTPGKFSLVVNQPTW